MNADALPVLWRAECRLSPEQLAWANHVGDMRQRDNEQRHRPDAYGARAGAGLHRQGAQAELSLTIMGGFPLSAWASYVETDDLKSIPADVGGFQVRSTTYRSGCLLLHPADRDEALFAFIINHCPVFTAAGWIRAGEAKAHREWWQQRNPRQAWAWFVPQSALKPFAIANGYQQQIASQWAAKARPHTTEAPGTQPEAPSHPNRSERW